MNGAERAYLEVRERLLGGAKPRDADNLRKWVKGTLTCSPTSVSREAGCSRGPIAAHDAPLWLQLPADRARWRRADQARGRGAGGGAAQVRVVAAAAAEQPRGARSAGDLRARPRERCAGLNREGGDRTRRAWTARVEASKRTVRYSGHSSSGIPIKPPCSRSTESSCGRIRLMCRRGAAPTTGTKNTGRDTPPVFFRHCP